MGRGQAEYGTFKNGIPYAQLGEGEKKLLLFFGGPGNTIPHGFGLRAFTTGLRPLLKAYTVHLVTRKSGLAQGYTTRDMSDDYAELIRQAFGGHVDVVIGMSYGGLIAQHFAADHAALFDHVVIAMAAHKGSEAGEALDRRFAKLLSEGKGRAAYATLAEVMAPKGILKPLMTALLWLAGGSMLGEPSGTFADDVLIEAEAELAHDATDSLKRIEVPALILCGDEDVYFPRRYVEEMAEMIEHATLKFYEGKGHTIVTDPQFARDVLEYIDSSASGERP